MDNNIYRRASEIISQGFEFGQLQQGMSWEQCLEGGPYSDMQEAIDTLSLEFGINANLAAKYHKMAFEDYDSEDELYETKKRKNMKQNIVKH